MQIQSSLLLVTLLLTGALAAPAPVPNKGRSFKVDRIPRSDHVRNGPATLRRAFNKQGWAVPETLQHTSTQAGGGETRQVPASPQRGDAEYLSPVNIGGQMLMLDFDTGSSDLWVFDTQLPSSQTRGHTTYDPSRSLTFNTINGATWSISYGDRSGARGNVGTDTVNVGGATVTGQAVELATTLSSSFVQDVNSDGLLGLAFSKLNTVKPTRQKTFFDNVMPSLVQPVFTANLKHATTGSYEFGNIDRSKYSGSLTYVPVDTSQGFWQFTSDRFSVDGQEQQNPDATPAIADTGTSLMLVDDAVAQAYYSQVQGAQNDPNVGGYTFPCSSTLPDFGVGVGGSYMAVIPGSGINFATVEPSSSTCFGGVQSNAGQPLQIYGDVMFKAQFVVFDGGNTALGFAPHS